MRWPWQRRVETRQSGAGFTDALIAGIVERAGGSIVKAQFANRRHGLAIAASRQALGDGWSPSSMR